MMVNILNPPKEQQAQLHLIISNYSSSLNQNKDQVEEADSISTFKIILVPVIILDTHIIILRGSSNY